MTDVAVISSICFCAQYPPTWASGLTLTTTVILIGLVLVPFIFTGVLLTERRRLIIIADVFVFYLCYALLYGVAIALDWQRPSYASGVCRASACDGQLFDVIINRVSFPEPLFITSVVFGAVYIYMCVVLHRDSLPILLTTAGVLYLALYSVAEFLGNRVSVGQYISNCAVAAVLSVVIILLARLTHAGVPLSDRAWKSAEARRRQQRPLD